MAATDVPTDRAERRQAGGPSVGGGGLVLAAGVVGIGVAAIMLTRKPTQTLPAELLEEDPSGAVWVTTAAGTRSVVQSAHDFTACGYDWGSVRRDPALADMPVGPPVHPPDYCPPAPKAPQPPQCPLSSQLLENLNGTIYVTTADCHKRGIASEQDFFACGYDWGSIHRDPQVANLPTGPNVVPPNDCPPAPKAPPPPGRCPVPEQAIEIDARGTVWITDTSCVRHGVPSMQVLDACGYDLSQARRDAAIVDLPQGSLVSASNCPPAPRVGPPPPGPGTCHDIGESALISVGGAVYVTGPQCSLFSVPSMDCFNRCWYDPTAVIPVEPSALATYAYHGPISGWPCPDAPRRPTRGNCDPGLLPIGPGGSCVTEDTVCYCHNAPYQGGQLCLRSDGSAFDPGYSICPGQQGGCPAGTCEVDTVNGPICGPCAC